MRIKTEEEYAFRFCLILMVEGEKESEMKKYAENFKNVLAGYSRISRTNPEAMLEDIYVLKDDEKKRENLYTQVGMLREICLYQSIDMISRQPGKLYDSLSMLLAEALYRTVILVRYYAPEGDLLADILKNKFFQNHDRTDSRISRDLNISKATLYRKKQKAIMYAGYLFYKAVLPEMEGKI